MEKKHNCDCEIIHVEVVKRVQSKMPKGEIFEDLSTLYGMFSDNTRARILWALNIDDMCVCDLAALLNKTKSAISHQLRFLKLANLVKYNKVGKVVYYSLADGHVKEILNKGYEHVTE